MPPTATPPPAPPAQERPASTRDSEPEPAGLLSPVLYFDTGLNEPHRGRLAIVSALCDADFDDGLQHVHLTIFFHPELDCRQGRKFSTGDAIAVPVVQQGQTPPMLKAYCRPWFEGLNPVTGLPAATPTKNPPAPSTAPAVIPPANGTKGKK